MSLDTAQLKTDLGAAFDATQVAAADAATAKQNFVNAMANAFETYVKTATVNYVGGLSAGSNPVIGTFNGGIF